MKQAINFRQAMDNAFDVLTFLAYAATLGLFIGALLGGVALLLSTSAHAADGDADGTLLLRRAPDAAATPARLISSETVLRSDGPIQRVRVIQAFRNPLQETLEGVYTLRLPDNATLERLVVRVSDAEDDGDEIDDGDAGPVASPALLSTEGTGVVARSIAGIEPGETVLIELEYILIGRYDRGRSVPRLLTRASMLPAVPGRRRLGAKLGAARGEAAPLGVEGAWVSRSGEPNAPWLWLLPVVALYVLVAFFS